MNARMPVFAGLSLALAYALAWLYGLLPEPRWAYVALIHTPLALGILWKGQRAEADLSWGPRWRFIARYAGPLYLLGIVGACLLSRLVVRGAPEITTPAWDYRLFLTVVWIPLIEECIFRGGVGRWLQSKLGLFTGMYLSALIFAAMHSSPPQNWMPPLGPFLLAFACEGIVRITGRLTPAILLHACCNASPLVFACLDTRWLDWLSALYLDLG